MIKLSACTMDLDSRLVLRDGDSVTLSQMEVKLLRYFLSNSNVEISREKLLADVWNYRSGSRTRTDHATVLRIRTKIERTPSEPDHLVTVRGVGYRFNLTRSESRPVASVEPAQGTVKGDERPLLNAPPNTWVGRTSDLSQIEEFVNSELRLITIKGIGGIGKTRLAQEFLWRHVQQHQSVNAQWIDMSDVRAQAQIWPTMGAVLRLSLEGETDQDHANQLGRALAGQGPSIFVLDNVEQISDQLAPWLQEWRAVAPEVTWILTSRRRLGLVGEQVFELGPLELSTEGVSPIHEPSPAVQLFVARAREVLPSFKLHKGNSADITAITTALDGLPLAIELAATWVRMMSPVEILRRMNDRFGLLTRNRAWVNERESTLGATLESSWELLEPWERLALAQCSVFRGGFTLDAAENILDLSAWDDAPSILDVMSGLVDHSLVRILDAYESLRLDVFVSVQSFGAEKLNTPEAILAPGGDSQTGLDAAQVCVRRHGIYYGALGNELHRGLPYSRETLREIGIESGNLWAASSLTSPEMAPDAAAGAALALSVGISHSGPFADGIALLERVGGSLGLTSHLQARCMAQHAHLMLIGGHLQQAEPLIDDLSAHLVAQPGQTDMGMLFDLKGRLCHLRGDLPTALSHLERAMDEYKREGRPLLETIARMNLALCRHTVGREDSGHQLTLDDSELALREMRACLSLFEAFNDAIHIIKVTAYIGILHWRRGEYTEAFAATQMSLDRSQTMSLRQFEANNLHSLAMFHLRCGQLSQAEEYCVQAVKLYRASGSQRGEGISTNLAGVVYGHLGRTAEQRDHIERSISLFHSTGNRALEAMAISNLGETYRKTGDLERARHLFERALALDDMTGHPGLFSSPLNNMASLHITEQEWEQAEEYVLRALRMAQGTNGVAEARSELLLALIRAHHGDKAEARRLAKEGVARVRGWNAYAIGTVLCLRGEVECLLAQSGDGDLEVAQGALREVDQLLADHPHLREGAVAVQVEVLRRAITERIES